VGEGALRFWLEALPEAPENAPAVLGVLTKAVSTGNWDDAEAALTWNNGEAGAAHLVGIASQWGGVEGMAGADESARVRLLHGLAQSDPAFRHAFGHAMGPLFPFSVEALDQLTAHGYCVAHPSLAGKWWETWLAHPVLHDLDESARTPRGRRTVQEAQAAAERLVQMGLPAGTGSDEQGRPWLHVLVASARPNGSLVSLEALDGWVSWWRGCGADIDERDRDGNSLLHACCATPHTLSLPRRLLASFLEASPQLIGVRNGVGQTPLDVFRATWREQGGLRRSDREAWESRARWLAACEMAQGLSEGLPKATAGTERTRL